MKKRLYSLLLCFTMVVALLPQTALFVSAADDNVCGENLTWALENDETLIISGTGAMTDYDSAEAVPWYSEYESIKTVIIEDTVSSIGNFAFASSAISSVTIGSGVTKIGKSAFRGCEFLTEISIPEGVSEIGEFAFSYTRLINITIPSSVSVIKDQAFSYCSSLTDITVDSANASYCDVEGVLFNKNQTTLIQFPVGKAKSSYTVPETVTTIGNSAFEFCSGLASIVLPSNLTKIGNRAFYSCSTLDSISIPNSVTTIGDSAFQNCTFLKSIVIPDSVTSLGEFAFSSCRLLERAVVGKNVTEIKKNTFANCSALTSVSLPDGITTFSEKAFYYCRALESIDLPAELVTIGVYAFYFCDSLKSVIIPENVEQVSKESFNYCFALETISFPAGITTVKERAFGNCPAIKDVYFAGTQEQWEENVSVSEDGNTTLIAATFHFAGAKNPLSVIEGAQIRTTGKQGLRFISNIDTDEIDFDRVVEFGTVLIPTADITDISELEIGAVFESGNEVAKVVAKNFYLTSANTRTFTAVITDIKEENYDREYSARAYAILDDGSVIYSATGTSRSVYTVASNALKNPNESEKNKAIFQTIVDLVKNK